MISVQDEYPDDVAVYNTYTAQYPEYSDSSRGQSDGLNGRKIPPILNAEVAQPVLTS